MKIKKVGLLRSTMTVSIFTMCSRLLGFVRDILVARAFGAGPLMDAFLVAFKIPNFMRRLFAEGAFSQAFVPLLAEYQASKTEAELSEFLAVIAGTFASVLLLVTLLVELTAPLWIYVFAPGFYDEPLRFDHATLMLRWTFPYMAFISLTAFTGSVLNTFSRFAIPAATPILLNAVMILFILFICPLGEYPIHLLAVSVFVAGLIQCIFQWPFLLSLGLRFRPRVNWKDPAVKHLLKKILPALFGVSVAQVNLLLDTLFASFLPAGSIAWLYYSDRLMNFPLGVFGVAISTVILPHLSRAFASRDQETFEKCLDWALRNILLIGLPSALGLVLLAEPLLVTLFKSKAFSLVDAENSAKSLVAFSLGIPAFMSVKVVASAFYSKLDISTPVKVGAVAMICNVFLNLALIQPLHHAGLALATTISGYINFGVLLYILKKRDGLRLRAGWGRYLAQLILALTAMGIFVFYAVVKLEQWHWLSLNFVWRLTYLLGLVGLAATLYFAVLFVFGYRMGQLKHFEGL